MILKKTTASDARTICGYLLGPGRSRMPGRATILGGTLLGQDVESLAAELNAIASIRPEVKRPFVHISFSAHPDDRHITDDEAIQMAEDWAWTADHSAWCLFRHDDHLRHDDHRPGRQHWHYLSSRVDEMGVLSRDRLRDFQIQMRWARKWEKFLGLVPVATPPRPDRPHGRATLERKSGRMDDQARARGKPLLRDVIRSRLDAVEALGLKGSDLRQALLAAGLDMDLRFAAGRPKGVTWVDQKSGQRMKGSDLGKRYTVTEWLKRNVLHDAEENRNGRHSKNVFPQFVQDDSQLDDLSGRRPKSEAGAKSSGTRHSTSLDGNLGCDGERPAVPCFSSGPTLTGDAAQPDPVATGLDRQDPTHQQRTGGAPERSSRSFHGARTDRSSRTKGLHTGGASGRRDDGCPMEPRGSDGMDRVPGGFRTARSHVRTTLGMGCLAVPKTSDPGGTPTHRANGTHDRELHDTSAEGHPEIGLPRRRGR